MRSKTIISLLFAILAIGVLVLGVGLFISYQNANNVNIPLIPTSPTPTFSPIKENTPTYSENTVIALAQQQPEAQAIYAAADKTKTYAFPETKDFNWTAQYYTDSGQWLVTFTYAQWDYNASGYFSQTKRWFFDEGTGKFTTLN